MKINRSIELEGVYVMRCELNYLAVMSLISLTFAIGASGQVKETDRDLAILDRLPFQLQYSRQALGDVLQKNGFQRVALTGVLTGPQKDQRRQLSVLKEYPSKIRFSLDGKAFGLDAKGKWKEGGALNAEESDLIEMLLSDTMESFLYKYVSGQPARFLGGRFRDDDGRSPGYKGPYHDLYVLINTVNKTHQVKRFYIDSDTLLLGRVRYKAARANGEAEVETQFKWGTLGGQKIPISIRRIEDKKEASSITFSSATVSPKQNDGALDAPPNVTRPTSN